MSRNMDAYLANLQNSAKQLFGKLPWFLRIPATLIFMMVMPFLGVAALFLLPVALILTLIVVIVKKTTGKDI